MPLSIGQFRDGGMLEPTHWLTAVRQANRPSSGCVRWSRRGGCISRSVRPASQRCPASVALLDVPREGSDRPVLQVRRFVPSDAGCLGPAVGVVAVLVCSAKKADGGRRRFTCYGVELSACRLSGMYRQIDLKAPRRVVAKGQTRPRMPKTVIAIVGTCGVKMRPGDSYPGPPSRSPTWAGSASTRSRSRSRSIPSSWARFSSRKSRRGIPTSRDIRKGQPGVRARKAKPHERSSHSYA